MEWGDWLAMLWQCRSEPWRHGVHLYSRTLRIRFAELVFDEIRIYVDDCSLINSSGSSSICRLAGREYCDSRSGTCWYGLWFSVFQKRHTTLSRNYEIKELSKMVVQFTTFNEKGLGGSFIRG